LWFSNYVLDSGFQAAGEAVLVSQAAQQAQLQVRPVFIEKTSYQMTFHCPKKGSDLFPKN
jgi:hypothetical protein